ncbi:MAG: DUF2391 domain-containing protein [Candidatus Nanohaloarchaea archaeon]|nr:DUF2391 domain-containing protein [Candidatus Nanohaloarchaea archaeon]
MGRPTFAADDLLQQLVGGLILSGPFVVTEEVWKLASNMSFFQAILANLIVFTIGYGALYLADKSRNPDIEKDIVGIPLRFISLLLVSYGSVLILVYLLSAPSLLGAVSSGTGQVVFKVVSVASIFSMVGAATADSVFLEA